MANLVDQPSWHPMRKLVAAVAAGAIMGAIQTLLRHFWPDHPFAPYMQDIELWLQTGVMAITFYFTRNKVDEPANTTDSLQGTDLGGDSGGLPAPVRTDEKETGKDGVGKPASKRQGKKT